MTIPAHEVEAALERERTRYLYACADGDYSRGDFDELLDIDELRYALRQINTLVVDGDDATLGDIRILLLALHDTAADRQIEAIRNTWTPEEIIGLDNAVPQQGESS